MTVRRIIMVATALAALTVPVLSYAQSQSDTHAGGPLRDVTSDEGDLLYAAEDVLLGQCLRRHGYAYQPQKPDAAMRPWNLPYVVDDLSWARSRGLGLTDRARTAAARRANPNQRYLESLPNDRRQAYTTWMYGAAPVGMSAPNPAGHTVTQNPGSCQSKAQDELYGDVRRWFRARVIVENLPALYLRKVYDDPRYIAAQSAWSTCMGGHGYQVSRPSELRETVTEPAPEQTTPSADEIAAAVAEATCAQETGFGAQARAVQNELSTAAATRFQADVDSYHRLQLGALPRATRIVADEFGK
ncbi:hypothetical protein AB0H43_13190 [Hamadaea sp. NPDC050747]|uniref:hypothetical protein n=1 Tax=Hamadaea sp. NPDC050747 TaxID=3155789 RepID=UPI0033D61FEE